jgi:hypothetical protein
MESSRWRGPSRRVLLWSALATLVVAAGITALFVARNADG